MSSTPPSESTVERRRLLILPLAIVVGYVVLLGLTLSGVYRQTVTEAERNQQNAARLVAALVSQAVDPIDQFLKSLAAEAQRPADVQQAPPLQSTLTQIAGFAVIDGTGRLRSGDERLARWMRDQPMVESQDRVIVSAPRVGPDGVLEILFCRPIVDRAGHVQGRVGALVPTKGFRGFLDLVDSSVYGSITLMLLDGTIVAMVPAVDGLVGTNVAESELTRSGMGAERFVAYQTVGNANLMIAMARDWADILKVWRRSAVVVTTMGLVMAVGMFLLSTLVMKWIQRQQEAEAARRASEIARIELHRLATTDGLTGALNRRAFLDSATAEIARSQRYNRALSVVFIDVDHFKSVNDTYGHAVGDEALLLIASACNEALRTEDVFGRLGGEEFAALLPETAMEKAKIIAERLRETIGRARLDLPNGRKLGMTASFGVASLMAGERTFDPMMKRADDALYVAKRSGRNRVEAAAAE